MHAIKYFYMVENSEEFLSMPVVGFMITTSASHIWTLLILPERNVWIFNIFICFFIDGFTIKGGSAVCMEPGRCRFISWAVYGLPFCEYTDAFFSPRFAVHWCLCICNKPADTLIKYINRLYYSAAFSCESSVTCAYMEGVEGVDYTHQI